MLIFSIAAEISQIIETESKINSEKKIKVVMAACILHNFCILENDNIDYFLQQVPNVRRQFLDLMYKIMTCENMIFHWP